MLTNSGRMFVLMLVLALLGAAPASTAAAPRCAPGDAKMEMETAEVQVYRDPGEDDSLLACSIKSGKTHLIDDPTGDIHAFPSVVVRGRFVAWAINVPSDTDISTLVQVADAEKFGGSDPSGALIHNSYGNYASSELSSKVGRIVLGREGDVAWTSCPSTDTSSPVATPKPNCVRAGALDRVWKLTGARRRPQSLARGRQLDPRSLRLSGNTLAWTNRGRRQRASLR
jgi:hypothetical protein